MPQAKQVTIDSVMHFLKTPIQIPFFKKASRAKKAALRRQKSYGDNLDSYSDSFVTQGALERGTTTKYAIGNEDFVIDSDTWIFGEVRLGAMASVKGERKGSQNFAKKIIIS